MVTDWPEYDCEQNSTAIIIIHEKILGDLKQYPLKLNKTGIDSKMKYTKCFYLVDDEAY
jgi:hypothetical protein